VLARPNSNLPDLGLDFQELECGDMDSSEQESVARACGSITESTGSIEEVGIAHSL
jgi:hypothetical protein